ncbi:hypothetical protein [Pseudoalteromonas rhizosphaerae]|uniref:hypothetical protein n=1 Tax=Pseudoalteromonas rhizosphaerae TaxID=2518973 RepID=UPI0012313460|nr:hypothetical protein [Pseudoalteromonas rhizosphaerae]
MNVYQLRKPTNTYDVIDLDIMEMAKQIVKNANEPMSDAIIRTVMSDVPQGNVTLTALSPRGFTCKHLERAKKQNYDINLYSSFLVLNKTAYTYLSAPLSEFGEFINLKTDGDKLYLFNPLTFAQEDLSLTEKAYLDGYEDELKSLAFDKEDVRNKLIFKSKLQSGLSLYCTDDFKELVNDNNLSGLVFNTDLLTYF